MILLALALAIQGAVPSPAPPQTVTIRGGVATLRALLWKPQGSGPFPAVLFTHGSYVSRNNLDVADANRLGSVFARHGYVFLFLFRRGVGLSREEGPPEGDLMSRAFDAGGQAARNKVQMELLTTESLDEARAGLAFLRSVPEVDAHRLVVAGHSFGGSIALVLAEQNASIRAVVDFGGAAASWKASPELRARLRTAVRRMRAPAFFVHAANDYSVTPGTVLAADMQRARKPHLLKIYPAVGRTASEGHNFLYSHVGTWETDVFVFLADVLGTPGPAGAS